MAPSHYQRLGVPPHASHEEIRSAYRRLAQQHHPDANPEAPGSPPTAAMAEINAAWEVLSDPEKRVAYDRAIGTTPRPRFYHSGNDEDGYGPDGPDDPLAHLRDDLDAPARHRPADVLVAIPVLMLIVAVAIFAFAAMSQNEGLRTASIMMAPITAGGFVAAPLFMMLRSRSRHRDEDG